MSDRNLSALAETLRAAQSVCLVSHEFPDGDTIGSALALRIGLERLGKTVEHFCVHKVPDNLMELPGATRVRLAESLRGDERFDLLLCVDIADERRAGTLDGKPVMEMLRVRCARTAQVDHHGTNPGYCEVNSVDGGAAAAGLLVRELLDVLGVALDTDLAACLYTAIATDTGNFSHGNTSAEVFRAAASLMDAGLELTRWNRRLFVERAMPKQLLIARAMSSLRYLCGGRLGVITLSRQDFAEAKATAEHADDIVNIALDTEGTVMALLAREEASGGIKCSLRALAPLRVDEIARSFGGGGHAQASGCTVAGELGEVTERVTAAMEKELKKQNV